MSRFFNDKVSIIKLDGSSYEETEKLNANVQKEEIRIVTSDFSLKKGDLIKRDLPNNTSEFFEIKEFFFVQKLGTFPEHFEISFEKKNFDSIEELLKNIEELKNTIKVDNGDSLNANKVFIVHGHDNEAKIEVARFVEKLGFEAIILHEQVSGGMTIIEKIEKNTDVGFSIVLYTPCDEGYPKELEIKKSNRARQNVVFEHGYLIGKLGRNRVCALVKGEVEVPNDISGIVYVPMDQNYGWRFSIAREMNSAGYNVDLNLLK